MRALRAVVVLALALPAAAQPVRLDWRVEPAGRAAPVFVPAAYEEVPGPARTAPPPSRLTEEQAEKVMTAMETLDRVFGRRDLTPEQWDRIVDAMLKAMAKETGDPHTQYFSKDEFRRFQQQMSGRLTGIGARVEVVPEGTKLDFVYPGSPAEAAGVRSGDVAVSANGVSLKGKNASEAVELIAGPAGTTVELELLRGGAPLKVVVTRAAMNLPNMHARLLPGGIGYVHFAQFQADTDAKLFAAIDQLRAQGATKLVIDVRSNGGGRLTAVNSMVSEFLRDGQVISETRRGSGVMSTAKTKGDGKYKDLPLAVLVDAASASASEVLASALQDHKRAVIVGQQTYGKGTFQSTGPLSDGSGVKITGGGWYSPNGRTIEGTLDAATGRNVPGSGGVTPDVVVPLSDAERRALTAAILRQTASGIPHGQPDPVLDAAIARLSAP